MKKLFVVLGIFALASCSLQTKEVLIDDKYDVVVESNVIKGERVYFINAISIWTNQKPPLSKQQDIFIEAIEQVAGCPVVQSSIRWVDAGIASNATMRAAVSC